MKSSSKDKSLLETFHYKIQDNALSFFLKIHQDLINTHNEKQT